MTMLKAIRYVVLSAFLTPVMSIAASLDDILESPPVQLEVLENARGMGGVVDITSSSHLDAVLADNDASGSITGSNIIDNDSFADARGIFSIIQNTGNNVIIQDSTVVTVTINPD